MNAKELRAKDEAALKQELNDLQNTHFKLRMQKDHPAAHEHEFAAHDAS